MTLFGPQPTPPPETHTQRPRWTKHDGHSRCDVCRHEAVRAARRGKTPPAVQPARWRRVYDGQDVRLCYQHARPVRADDDRKATR